MTVPPADRWIEAKYLRMVHRPALACAGVGGSQSSGDGDTASGFASGR
jgi:hypothetical protein